MKTKIVLIFLVMISLIGCECARQESRVKIGAILPLTGDMATFGKSFKNGIDLAVSEFNEGSSNEQRIEINVSYEDDKGDARTAVDAFDRLTNVQGIRYVVGGVMSSTAVPIAPLAVNRKVIFLSPTATSATLNGFKDFVYRMQPGDNYEGSVMAHYAYKDLGLKRVAVLYVNNDWGVGLENVFETQFRALGGQVVCNETFALNANDFRSQITEIKRVEQQALYLLGYYPELSGALRQMKQLGLKTRILSAYSFYDPRLLKLAGHLAEGAIVSVSAFDPKDSSETVRAFVKNYKAKYGSEPDMFAAHSYDCIALLCRALEKTGNNPEEVNKALRETRNFRGVTGLTSYDNGKVIKEVRIVIVKDGKFQPVTGG
jgi:branched-chain amino acid transport system substrate-binding protein